MPGMRLFRRCVYMLPGLVLSILSGCYVVPLSHDLKPAPFRGARTEDKLVLVMDREFIEKVVTTRGCQLHVGEAIGANLLSLLRARFQSVDTALASPPDMHGCVLEVAIEALDLDIPATIFDPHKVHLTMSFSLRDLRRAGSFKLIAQGKGTTMLDRDKRLGEVLTDKSIRGGTWTAATGQAWDLALTECLRQFAVRLDEHLAQQGHG